jgi:hypothetical protein
MHFSRDNSYSGVPIFEGSNELLTLVAETKAESLFQLLTKYRKVDKT